MLCWCRSRCLNFLFNSIKYVLREFITWRLDNNSIVRSLHNTSPAILRWPCTYSNAHCQSLEWKRTWTIADRLSGGTETHRFLDNDNSTRTKGSVLSRQNTPKIIKEPMMATLTRLYKPLVCGIREVSCRSETTWTETHVTMLSVASRPHCPVFWIMLQKTSHDTWPDAVNAFRYSWILTYKFILLMDYNASLNLNENSFSWDL